MSAAAEAAKTIDLSIVIPVYNESQKIIPDIRAAADFCSRHGLTGEILVADDGSEDGTAEAAEICRQDIAAQEQQAAGVNRQDLRILRLTPHRGKGHAVREGMIQSSGRHILFIDSGGCIPFDEIMRGLARIARGECEIAHASRKLPESIIVRPQPLLRRISAWLFSHLFIRFLGLFGHLSDTQAGLKIYQGKAGRMLYQACASDGFLFDAEIIIRAERAGLRICEFPVTWSSDPDSRLRLRWMPLVLVRDAIVLKRQLAREFRQAPAARP